MASSQPQWLLFDLDGTLVDSAPDLATSINYMLAQLQLSQVSELLVRGWIGDGATQLIKRALEQACGYAVAETELETAKALFFSAYKDNVANQTEPYPDCASVLYKLMHAGIRLGCVTNKPRQFVQPLLARLGLSEYFSATVCGDDMEHKKPHAEPLLHAINQLNATHGAGYMIGDSITDMQAAHAAGIDAIYATYGYNRDVSVDEYDPLRIHGLADLLPLFIS